MKIYKAQNVLDAALERIRFLFDEFETVVVSFSGGKDSTVVLNLALQVAEEKGRLPLKVLFLDQEAEWTLVIDYIRSVMYDPRVEPWWMQIPLRLYNSTSTEENWLHCWDPAAKERWIHPQDPISKKENHYDCDRFKELFERIFAGSFAGQKTVYLAGVRCEESPSREMGLTHYPAYKWLTWGKLLSRRRGHYTMYPIYDWSLHDVWKAIHEHGWPYCGLYDAFYSYGVALRDMRVSNVHHETAVRVLFILQEIDPAVWERLTQRLKGINTAGQLRFDSISTPTRLPYMFKSWTEYRDYLLENLCNDETIKQDFRKKFAAGDKVYRHRLIRDNFAQNCITAILVNDTGAKIENFRVRPEVCGYRRYMRGLRHETDATNKYVQDAIKGKHHVRTDQAGI
jgi:predicted phosphoadenosine phosphosulfate sulfurtransferase